MVRLWALAAIWCCILPTTQAASTQEINALLDFGFKIWNSTSTDPCTWTGIACNNNSSITNISLSYQKLIGIIPSSIGNLSNLQYLEIYQNNLTGEIPPSIGNLTYLLRMKVDNNKLTGGIPSSISQLKSLQDLSLGSNNLTGNIPTEMGNMISLKTLYLDNNNLSGPIPSSLGNLINLKELVLSTNFLTGSIPQEFGRLQNLTMLLLNANKLSGELPSSFSNLTNMSTLTLSSNAFSGSISVLGSMSALKKLWLQRNNFSGAIFNGSFPNLEEFDLGFNNFTGGLPASLEAPKLLRFFAGHNRLTGSIPSSFSSSLTNLEYFDVSHNSLTGSSKISLSAKQQDLSFNYFYDYEQKLNCDTNNEVSNSSLGVCYPSTTGNRTSYGINAGGDAITSGNATFQGDSNAQYDITGLYQVGDNWFLQISSWDYWHEGTVSIVSGQPDIYKSMRWSATYLAYHGTQLRNGRYQVTLYFAELVDNVYVNYRLFDVLIQGKVVAKDLDVFAKVGKNTGYNFSAEEEVVNGTLSIEFIGNHENYWGAETTGPMISAIYVSPMFSVEKSKTKSQILIILLAAAASMVVLVVLGLIAFFVTRRRRANRNLDRAGGSITNISKIGPTVYTYKQLLEATEQFNEKLMLGKGGFGAVYKGTLADGSVVAVKQLTKKTKKSAEAFKKEIAILSMLQHRNLVGIKGYCLNSGVSLLVCDFIENGSLEKFLFKGPILSWQARRKIAIGAACGLQYLHEGSRYQVIHCDIKPANILLDKELNAYIGDFGLAKLYQKRVTQVIVTKLGGTIGYIAPEYSDSHELSEKIDVYSFGVVLLELLSGKRALGETSSYIVSHVQEIAYVQPNFFLNLIDEKLDGEFDKQEALDMTTIAVLCTQRSPDARPRMRDVWLMLNNISPIPPLPQYSVP